MTTPEPEPERFEDIPLTPEDEAALLRAEAVRDAEEQEIRERALLMAEILEAVSGPQADDHLGEKGD